MGNKTSVVQIGSPAINPAFLKKSCGQMHLQLIHLSACLQDVPTDKSAEDEFDHIFFRNPRPRLFKGWISLSTG